VALPAKNRLSKKLDFDTVFKGGRTVKGSFLFIRVIENGRQMSRFGFVISSKVFRQAVVRNKVRRKLSEVLRLNLGKIRAGYDVIIVVKSRDTEIHKLTKELEDTLVLAKLYDENSN